MASGFGSLACTASPMSLILSLAKASSEPDSSIARPSLPSFTFVTLALTRRCFNAASSLRLGRRAGDDADVLASEVGELLQGGALDEKAAAVEKDQRREIDVLHPRLRRRGIGAVDIGFPGSDHGDPFARRCPRSS